MPSTTAWVWMTGTPTILDVKLPALTIPVKPGRNLAIIVEVAAMNNRQKKKGYNAAQEFNNQINAHFEQAAAARRRKNRIGGMPCVCRSRCRRDQFGGRPGG